MKTKKKANKKKISRIKRKWLEVVKQAVEDGEKIKVNHHYIYKGKRLGTFLVDAKRNGNIELIEEIKKIGIDFDFHSHEPKHVIKRFIHQLENDPNPYRHGYVNRFNKAILPKREMMTQTKINEINRLWKKKFGEKREWKLPKTVEERIQEWKDFRYDKEANPDGKWFRPLSKMGSTYFWVYMRKRRPELMEKIWGFFTKKELKELKKEGFRTPAK